MIVAFVVLFFGVSSMIVPFVVLFFGGMVMEEVRGRELSCGTCRGINSLG